MARRLTKQEKRERLGAVIQNELSRAENRGDGMEASRRRAVANYLARPRGDEVKDRSTAISTDVRDMVNAVLATLVPMVSSDSVVEFEAMAEGDEDAAQAESDVLNRLIIEDNAGFIQIESAVKDALLLRNGAMKCWIEDSLETEQSDVSELAGDEQNALVNRAYEAGATRARVEDGQLIVEFEERAYRVAAVPIEACCWSSGLGGLQDKRFWAEAMDLTRSQLIERGVPRKVVEELGTSSAGRTRQVRSETEDDLQGETPDQEVIGCHECWIRIDEDGDGVSERYRVLVANENQVLEQELMPFIPYALGTVFINPHRLEGESLADHLFQVQDVKTSLMRQFLDNLQLGNNGKYAYDPARTNEDDVLNPIAGGGIRSRDPASAVIPLAIPDTTAGSLAGLGYMDQRRTEAGGAALDMMRADMQLASETAWGTERQYASRELMVSMMAANLGETLLRGLWTMVHRFIRTYAAEPFEARLRGQFVKVDPRSWRRRTRLNVTIGKTPGQRGHMQQTLMQHQQMQMIALQAGLDGVLVDAGTVQATSTAILRLGGVDNPAAHILDPSSPAAQQAMQQKQAAAEKQQQQQLELIRAQIQLEGRKLQVEERKNNGELAYKYFSTETDMAIEEAKLVGGAALDLEKQAREAAATARREAAAARAEPQERAA